jgi:16S rRNA (uracil1498-N3)-methyltransferase
LKAIFVIRLFLAPEQLSTDKITITGDQARHLALVLRAQPGDKITIMDGQGYKYECRLISVHKKEVVAEVLNKTTYSVESPLSITLAQGIAKGDKMDFVIQKSTELGVNRIIPVITEYSQVKHTHKVQRWRKIALSAAQQSGRDKVPEILEPITLEEYLSQQLSPAAQGYIEDIKGVKPDSYIRIILSENYKKRAFKEILSGLKENRRVIVLVGPEGGFSQEEISAAVEKDFIEVSIGPRILRTETAPLAALSIIQYELGDMGE